MPTKTFPIPVVEKAYWPDRLETRRVVASLCSNDGEILATRVPGVVTINPPEPGIGRTNNPGAPFMAQQTEILREPFYGSWVASFMVKSVTYDVANLCGKTIEMKLSGGRTGKLIVTHTTISQGKVALTCEGDGVPPLL